MIRPRSRSSLQRGNNCLAGGQFFLHIPPFAAMTQSTSASLSSSDLPKNESSSQPRDISQYPTVRFYQLTLDRPCARIFTCDHPHTWGGHVCTREALHHHVYDLMDVEGAPDPGKRRFFLYRYEGVKRDAVSIGHYPSGQSAERIHDAAEFRLWILSSRHLDPSKLAGRGITVDTCVSGYEQQLADLDMGSMMSIRSTVSPVMTLHGRSRNLVSLLKKLRDALEHDGHARSIHESVPLDNPLSRLRQFLRDWDDEDPQDLQTTIPYDNQALNAFAAHFWLYRRTNGMLPVDIVDVSYEVEELNQDFRGGGKDHLPLMDVIADVQITDVHRARTQIVGDSKDPWTAGMGPGKAWGAGLVLVS